MYKKTHDFVYFTLRTYIPSNVQVDMTMSILHAPSNVQVDTYATVVTLHILAHRNYNFEVVFCEETLKYRACRKIPR